MTDPYEVWREMLGRDDVVEVLSLAHSQTKGVVSAWDLLCHGVEWNLDGRTLHALDSPVAWQ